jgi:hypothetical protein
VKTTKPIQSPKPRNIVLVLQLEYDWTCQRCGNANHGTADYNSHVLYGRCGHCHFVDLLDFNRIRDAPEAAINIDNLAVGSRTEPRAQTHEPLDRTARQRTHGTISGDFRHHT